MPALPAMTLSRTVARIESVVLLPTASLDFPGGSLTSFQETK
jgi:hypothetical protein